MVEIEFQADHLVRVLITIGDEAEIGVRLDAPYCVERHGCSWRESYGPGLHGGQLLLRVLDEANHEPVDMRLWAVPVVRVALIGDVTPTHPFTKDERAGPNGLGAVRIHRHVAGIVEVRWRYRRLGGGESVEEKGRRLRQRDDGRMRVWRANRNDAGEGGAATTVHVSQQSDRRCHVA